MWSQAIQIKLGTVCLISKSESMKKINNYCKYACIAGLLHVGLAQALEQTTYGQQAKSIESIVARDMPVEEISPLSSNTENSPPQTSPELERVNLNYTKININQVVSEPPNITLYLSGDHEQANTTEQHQTDIPISNPVSATIGQWSTEVQRIQLAPLVDEGVAVVFLVDISRSINNEQFAQIKQSLMTWINALSAKDKVAIVTFGSSVQTIAAFTDDKEQLNAAITSLKLTDNESLVYQGLSDSLQLAKSIDSHLPARRAIVTLTDGIDDNVGGYTYAELMQQISVDAIPIYALGYYRMPKTTIKDNGVKQLAVLARQSGGRYFSALEQPFNLIYQQVHAIIQQQWKVNLHCSECVADGRVYRLQFTLFINQDDGSQKQITDGMDIRLLPNLNQSAESQQPEPEPTEQENVIQPQVEPIDNSVNALIKKNMPIVIISIMVLLLLIMLSIIIKTRKSKKPIANNESWSEQAEQDITTGVCEPVIKEADKPDNIGHMDKQSPIAKICLFNLTDAQECNIEVGEFFTIGRKDNNHLVIKDEEVSGQHCALIFNASIKRVLIRDLQSTNGTSVNGVPIKQDYVLTLNDVINIGKTEIRFNGDV